MPSKVTIPNTFATATTAIPLSQLDANFSNVNAAINNALTFSNYALDAGTANTYSVSITGQTTTYAAGLAIQFLALNTNTGASTLNVNAQGAKTIVNTSGAALTAGAITAGAIVSVMYDGTNFQLLNDAGTQSETFLNLTVTGTTNTANLIVTQTGATFAAGSNTAPAITTTGDTNTGIFFPAADTIAFAEGGVESMRIDSSGNVGIGTSSVATKLNVKGSAATLIESESTGAESYLGLKNSGGYAYVGSSANNLLFLTSVSGTERMRIDSSGNVGIGTSSPTDESGYGRALDIRSATGAAIYFRDSDDITNDTLVIGRDNANSYIDSKSGNLIIYNAGSERARINSNGNLLVGTIDAGAGAGFETRIAVSSVDAAIFKTSGVGATSGYPGRFWHNATSGNNLFVDFATETAYTPRGNIDYNRSAGQVRYNATSDATLKNIFGDSNGQKSLEILNSTRIREYAWKDDPTQKPQVGVIAQELYETYKGAVSVGGEYEVEIPAVTEQRLVSEAVLDEEGNEIEAAVYETVEVEPSRRETKYRPWGVDKTAFTFHLIAGWQAHEKLLKEAMIRIEALEAEVVAMKAGNGN